MATSVTYKFSKKDTAGIVALKYDVVSASGELLHVFMQREFPGFNLYSLLQEVEKSFSPTTSLPIVRQIYFEENSRQLTLYYSNESANEDEMLIFHREFLKSRRSIIVDHSHCIIPKGFQGRGLIKKVFQASLEQYVQMKAKKITVYASLGGGGYVWARHGFVATDKTEVEEILEMARTKLKKDDFEFVENIFKKYYKRNPAGKAFPMILWAYFEPMKNILMGSDWQGELDLKNSEQFRNFRDYVYRP